MFKFTYSMFDAIMSIDVEVDMKKKNNNLFSFFRGGVLS